MSLRITFVAPFGLKQKTTVWARTLPIAQQLGALGHDASILVPPWDSPEDAGKRETVAGVSVEQVALTGGTASTVRRLLAAIDDRAPDIVHIVKPRAHAGLVQWWLWQRRRATGSQRAPKLLLDVDDWEQAWNPVNRYAWPLARFLTWQEEWGIRHADGITTASRWLEAKVATVAPHIPTYYLPNGVDPLPSAPQPHDSSPDAAPQILFFTRFVEVQPEWLRTFWQAIQVRLPEARLLIAGTPVQPWLAEPFRATLANERQIEWLGYVPTPTLADLYARATCAIFPAMPVPLLQAKCSVRLATTLLHGLPVVASAVGEQANYGADGAAHLVPAEATAEEFAAATVALIQSAPQDARTRLNATTQMLTRYAWRRLVEPLPAFYTTILNR